MGKFVLKLVPMVFVFVSIMAAIRDCYNAALAFTAHQTWEHDGLYLIINVLTAITLAALSWAAPIQTAKLWQEKKRFYAFVMLLLTIACTLFNCANSKAYGTQGWQPVPGVSGPVVIGTPWTGTLYESADWYRDINAYFAPLTLLSLVVLMMDKKEELSPEEEAEQIRLEAAHRNNALLREQLIAPLREQEAKQRAQGFKGLAKGVAEGFGINLPTKPPENDSTPSEDDPDDDSSPPPPAEAIENAMQLPKLTFVPPDSLTTDQVALILGINARTVRLRCQKLQDDPAWIPGELREVEGYAKPIWVIATEQMLERYPKEMSAWQKKKQRAETQRQRREGAKQKPALASV